jgi:phospholipid/cholesterol/gamma-HCH transport system substrate-binding protein
MEIRAPYVLIGSFVLAAILAVFGFVYWLHNSSGFAERAVYYVRFEKTVGGLQTGAAVLFNGVRVGEVTALRVDRDRPQQVLVSITVTSDTPIRADTAVELDFQGLTGVPVIALSGGASAAPVLKPQDTNTVLIAPVDAGQSLTQSARIALRRIDAILAENAEPFHATINNLSTFAAALGRNSERVDTILAGLEQFLGGKQQSDIHVYDLAAPETFPTVAKRPREQFALPEPTAVLLFDTQNVLLRSEAGESTIANAKWSDNLPKLIQAKIMQSFENAGLIDKISRSGEANLVERQILIDIRKFQIAKPEALADVEFSARITDRTGRIIQARVFQARVGIKDWQEPNLVEALNQAFKKTAAELVLWASSVS